jgi:hypothetical protein
MFASVVIIAFHLKMYQNNIFLKKIISDNSISKWFENIKKY